MDPKQRWNQTTNSLDGPGRPSPRAECWLGLHQKFISSAEQGVVLVVVRPYALKKNSEDKDC